MRLWLIWAGASVLSAYIGAERCKLCHRDVFESWESTAHARAPSPRVREEVEGNPRCASCHTTGEGRLPGVQCEACHGPGSDYSEGEVMIDPEKAAMAGLVWPTEATCRRCHGGREPGHQRDFVMPEGTAWAEAVHARTPP